MTAINKDKKSQMPPPVTPPVDLSAESGAGFDGVRPDDLPIPFLVILQKGSPEVDRGHPQYVLKGIKGAKQGDVMNTLTRELFDTSEGPLQFVPCTFMKMFVEWTDRAKGGGIVQSHMDPAILSRTRRNEKGQDVLANGNIIMTTAYFFGLHIREDGERVRAVIGMTSTQLKKARQWLSVATSIRFEGAQGKYTPPFYSHIYNLTTVPESNQKGNWMGWKIEIAGPIADQPLLMDAREVVSLTKSTQFRLAPPPMDEHTDPGIPEQ